MRKLGIIFLLLSIILISGVGCSKSEKNKNNDLQVAKKFLENAEYNYANQYFQRVLSRNPNDGQALIGAAVSQFFALTVDLANYIASVSGINKSKNIPSGGFNIMAGTKTEKEDILKVVKKLLGGLIVRWEKMDYELDLAKQKGTYLYVPTLPVMWNMEKIMDFGGKIDRTDIYFLSAFSKLFLGSIKFFLSQGIDIDIFKIYAQYYHLKELRINGNQIPTPLLLLNILTYILNDPELNFLGLSTWDLNNNGIPDGREFYSSAISYFTDAYNDIMEGINYGEKESITKDRVFWVVDSTKLEGWKYGEKDFLNSVFGEGVKYDILLYKRFYYNNVTASVHFMLDQTTLDAMTNIYKNLKYHSPQLIDFKDNVLPILSTIVASLLKLNQDIHLINIGGKYGGLINSTILPPSTVNGLIAGMVPDVVALDLHTFFSNPVSFRTLLPPWRNDLDKDENMFFLEWDTSTPYEPGVLSNYPLLGPWGIILPVDQPPEDVDHFTAGVYYTPEYRHLGIRRIAKDTIAMPLPYIAFRNNDASFNGLLYLSFGHDAQNVSDVLNLKEYYSSDTYPTTFSPATARDFNAFVGIFYKKFQSIIDSFIYKKGD